MRPEPRRLLASGVLLALTLASCQAPAPTRPNVVVILVDDARWDDFGFTGHPFVQTPAVDRLAEEGTRFTNAFATTPLCSPSRAAILTGQYVHTNGIIDNTARDSASHLQSDPFELENLIGTEAGNRVLPELRSELERLKRETGYRREFRGFGR